MTIKELAVEYGVFELCGNEPLPESAKETLLNYYETILRKTDHIANKVAEYPLLGKEVPTEWVDKIHCREECREQIRVLEESETIV